MRHLPPETLIDLAEGTRPESSAPHLESCERCRGQLAELRATMSAAADVDVPEPSPLFWGHFSARVSGAIAAEGAPRAAAWLDGWSWSRLSAPVAVAGVIVLAAIVSVRMGAPARPLAPSQSAASSAEVVAAGDPALSSDDPSLDLVADLAEGVEWDTASEPGLTPHEDAVDRAVGQLNDTERRELQRLLKEELAHAGA
jgi:hypothetical protein